MGTHRLLLYFTLFFISYLLWAQWQMDYGPKPVDISAEVSEHTGETTHSSDIGVPLADVPDTLKRKTASVETSTIVKTSPSQRIQIVTDVIAVEIDTRGGSISKLTLRNYAVEADKPDIKLDLLSDRETSFQVAQSGLVSVNAGSAPTHNANYVAEQFVYRLGEGENEIRVPLHWSGENGEKVTKTFIFNRGDYTINVNHSVIAGNSEWSGSQYMQVVRGESSGEGESMFIRSYTGGVIFNDEIKYEKYDFEDMAEENLSRKLKDGWLAMIQHYFLAAWIPEKNSTNLYYSRHNTRLGHYTLGIRSPAKKQNLQLALWLAQNFSIDWKKSSLVWS